MIKPFKDGTLIRLYIQPGASRSGWDKVFDDRQKVKIKAPPRDGEANLELIRFIAESFSISKSRVTIMRGESSRQKDLFIDLDFNVAHPLFLELTKN
jgi:uncharacterized protein (TIGR00251 family)